MIGIATGVADDDDAVDDDVVVVVDDDAADDDEDAGVAEGVIVGVAPAAVRSGFNAARLHKGNRID